MHSPPRSVSGTPTRLDRVGLAVLYFFIGVSLVGYATFGLNPGLLARFPQFTGFYAISFNFFAQAQIWLAAVVLALFLIPALYLLLTPADAGEAKMLD